MGPGPSVHGGRSAGLSGGPPWRIAVQSNPFPRPARILDAIAHVAKGLGWSVACWRWPAEIPLAVERVVCWNGSSGCYAQWAILDTWRYAEIGWIGSNSLQLNRGGVNGKADWAADQPRLPAGPPYIPALPGYLLVLLQDDAYIRAAQVCPWFANDAAWLTHLARWSCLPVRVRAHPAKAPTEAAAWTVHDSPNMQWDTSPTCEAALAGAAGVAVISSAGGVAAMRMGRPLLCYGKALYRRPYAVWCMTGSPILTYVRTMQLSRWHCDLSRRAVHAVLRNLWRRQCRLADLPRRLPDLMA